MRFFSLLIVALAATTLASGKAHYEVDDGVAVLTDSNFDSVVNNQPLILVEFYAPWCGHCKSLAPEYAKAAKTLEGKIILAKVDATVETELAERFEVKGYPTLKIFRNSDPSEYKGGRTAETIVSYLEKQLQPALTFLSSVENAKSFATSSKVVIIGFFPEKTGVAYEAFANAVTQLRDDFSFGEVIANGEIAAALEVGEEFSIVLFKSFDDGKVTLVNADNVAQIVSFIRSESMPLLDEISRENYKNYVDLGLPIAWIFYDPADTVTKQQLDADFAVVARDFKRIVAFVYCDAIKYASQAKNLGLTGDVKPSLAILRPSDDAHFAFSESSKLTKDDVTNWVGKFVEGKIEPTVKSEAEPVQDGPVTVLVGSTFRTVAEDPKKDVLVEFYAPWCGHCKNLAPIYDQLGERFKGVPSVVIAKMDATANDAVGVKIQGFPTIKFFPANGHAMMDYSGERDLASFVSFIEKNAQIPFKLDGASSGKAHDHAHHGHGHAHGDHDEL